MSRPSSSKRYRQWSRRIERNLLACWTRANEFDRAEGMHWYQSANDDARIISEKYNIPLESVLGVIAALSPGNSWGKNLLDAEVLISEWSKGYRGNKLPLVGTYGRRNRIKSEKILGGKDPLEILGGSEGAGVLLLFDLA